MPQPVTAIIQARMNSSRLPGKVMKKVMGRPLLSYQLERLRQCHNIKDCIIATTSNKTDDSIAELAILENIKVFRGSENDVLDRYYQTAKIFDCAHIMRITADCPLIQASYCDEAIETYRTIQPDNLRTDATLAEGLGFEIFSFTALEQAQKQAVLYSEREHVSLYFLNNPDTFYIYTKEYQSDDSYLRLTVDEPEDFQVIQAIIEALYNKPQPFNLDTIKDFLTKHPEIYMLNQHIIRDEGLLKSLANDFVIDQGQ